MDTHRGDARRQVFAAGLDNPHPIGRIAALLACLVVVPALSRCGATVEDADSGGDGDTGGDDGSGADTGGDDGSGADTGGDDGSGADTGEMGVCHDGSLDPGEECELLDLRGETCATLGLGGGELVCDDDCRIDTSGCTGAPTCGDGVAEGDEECDVADFGGVECADFEGPFGRLECTAACVIDHSHCGAEAYCGDGAVSDSEECDDGNTLDGDGCDGECFDESCGDGILQPGLGEECDQGDVIILTCSGLPGREVGIGVCGAACVFDAVVCPEPARCGDGAADLGEACDDGNTTDGDGCSSTCLSERCGDGVLDPGEACDASCTGSACSGGTGLGSRSCADYGLDLGALACTDCWIDPAACAHSTCGDGAVEGDEGCDDGNLESGDGCAADCVVEPGCDEGERIPVWPDTDGDSFGDGSAEPTMVCTPPEGVAWNDQDCDDTDASISPSDPEICGDARDNDCDSEDDEDCGPACDESEVPADGEGLDLTVYVDRAEFEAALGYCAVVVDFDELVPGAFPASQFVPQGIEITGEDGQYADTGFGYPEEFRPASAPNMYAPGPTAASSGAATDGGNTTTVRFLLPDAGSLVYAGTAAFGLTFIDADFPSLGPATMVFYSRSGVEIGRVSAVHGANGSHEFRGAIVTDLFGDPYSGIYSVVVTNGSGWPGVSAGEGVAMDDFLFASPTAISD